MATIRSTTIDPSTSDPVHERRSRSSRIAAALPRTMYAANVLVAGVPGAIIVFAPQFARDQLFVVAPEPMTMSILGSIWLAIGVVSTAGLADPGWWRGVFAVQAVYKTVWVVTGAATLLPDRADVWPYAIGFTLAAVGFVGALTALARQDAR